MRLACPSDYRSSTKAFRIERFNKLSTNKHIWHDSGDDIHKILDMYLIINSCNKVQRPERIHFYKVK